MVAGRSVGCHCRQSRSTPRRPCAALFPGRSMRIGLIAPPWIPVPPPAYGGTESVLDRLARGLVRAGHHVLLGAAANSTCPVGRVPGTEEAADGAPANGGAVTEVRHGRGPDKCIDAVRMEATHGATHVQRYDRVKLAVRLESDRPHALRRAILSCRSGGIVSV